MRRARGRPGRAGGRSGAVLGRLALLACGLVLALGGAELVVRALPETTLGFHYADGVFGPPREFAPDPAVNSLGFHDREPGPKAAGTRRVLLLGDSYVAARSVRVPQTVGRRLAAHLDELAPGRWDVVALGKPGWGQREELDALRALGPRLEPDVVLTLFLSFNDVRNNSPLLQAFGEEEGPGARRPGKLWMRAEDLPFLVLPGSALNRLLSWRLARARVGREPEQIPLDYQVYRRERPPEWERAWEATLELLNRTRDEARRLGARYLVASASTPHGVRGPQAGLERLLRAYPAMRDADWDLERVDRELERACRRADLSLLLLEPRFREESAAGRTLHWPHDGHWNAAGNDLAGELLARFVLETEP